MSQKIATDNAVIPVGKPEINRKVNAVICLLALTCLLRIKTGHIQLFMQMPPPGKPWVGVANWKRKKNRAKGMRRVPLNTCLTEQFQELF